MSSLPISGAISDNMIEIIEKGGVVVSNEKIIDVGNFELLSKKENEVIERLINLKFYYLVLLTVILMFVILELDQMSILKEMLEYLIKKFYLREVESIIQCMQLKKLRMMIY